MAQKIQKITAEKKESEKEKDKMAEKIANMTAEKQVSEDQIKTLQKRIMELELKHELNTPEKEVHPLPLIKNIIISPNPVYWVPMPNVKKPT